LVNMVAQAMPNVPQDAKKRTVQRTVIEDYHSASAQMENYCMDDAVLRDCPTGFHASGAYCLHNDEDHFWKDANQQNSLRELLNSGTC
uniref:Kringle domain-containing protein n=1 Tax=Gongylonema pulchrum TaxID=637853 RepID=A0A183DFQ0_9BILA